MIAANRHPQGVGQFSDVNLGQLSNGIYNTLRYAYEWASYVAGAQIQGITGSSD